MQILNAILSIFYNFKAFCQEHWSGSLRPASSTLLYPKGEQHSSLWRESMFALGHWLSGLNDIIDKNLYPLPLMSSAFELLQRGRPSLQSWIFTMHIILCGLVRGMSVKLLLTGHFEYRLMPFGPFNAPDIFQVLINDVLQDMVNKLVQLDDF